MCTLDRPAALPPPHPGACGAEGQGRWEGSLSVFGWEREGEGRGGGGQVAYVMTTEILQILEDPAFLTVR